MNFRYIAEPFPLALIKTHFCINKKYNNEF